MPVEVVITNTQIQIRRGLEADRTSITPASGELLYTTDDGKLYVGDGTTAGGNRISAEVTDPSDLPSGIDAVKIADGSVSNTEFQLLNGLTGTIWTSSNDGTGSGLDADLLDGEEGSFYQNASNINAGTLSNDRLSNIPASKIADGAGSGLDADLLDGLEGSAYFKIDVENTSEARIVLVKGDAINSSLFSTAAVEARTAVSPPANIVPAYGFHIPSIIGGALYMGHTAELRFITSGAVDERILRATNLKTENNKLSATDTNGDVELEANGTGEINFLSDSYTKNNAHLDSLISKAKGDIIKAVLDLSDQDDFSDIKMLHLFDNDSGTAMADVLGGPNGLTLSSASSSSTRSVEGTCSIDNFTSFRYFTAADDDSLSFGNGTTDGDFSIIIAGIPNAYTGTDNYLLGKWRASGNIEYGLVVGGAGLGTGQQYLYFIKGDTSVGAIRIRYNAEARTSDVGGFNVYAATSTGEAASGMKLYVNGVAKSPSSNDSGTYTAMENGTTALGNYYVQAGGAIHNPSISDFKYALILLIAKELTAKDIMKISKLLHGIAGQL